MLRNGLKYGILCIPLFWFLGINFVIFHLIVLLMLLSLLARKNVREKLLIPVVTFPSVMFILTYIFSIIVNLGEISFVRLLATLYNLSFWVEGFILIIVIYNTFIKEKDVREIVKCFTFLGTMCGLLSVAGILL